MSFAKVTLVCGCVATDLVSPAVKHGCTRRAPNASIPAPILVTQNFPSVMTQLLRHVSHHGECSVSQLGCQPHQRLSKRFTFFFAILYVRLPTARSKDVGQAVSPPRFFPLTLIACPSTPSCPPSAA